jgi:hypothetical protein
MVGVPKKLKNFVRVLHINEGNGPEKSKLEEISRQRGDRIEVKEVGAYEAFNESLTENIDVILFTAHSV